MLTDMIELRLNQNIINKVREDAVLWVRGALGNDVRKIILYGSCARRDFSDDSDVDIALLVTCDRADTNKYSDVLAGIATKLAAEYLAIVNFVCLPEQEFLEKKCWYPYFKNIDREGEVIYEG